MSSIKRDNPSKVIIIRRPSNSSGETDQKTTSEENEKIPVEPLEEGNLPEGPVKKETPEVK